MEDEPKVMFPWWTQITLGVNTRQTDLGRVAGLILQGSRAQEADA